MLGQEPAFDQHDILAAGVARARNTLESTTLAAAVVDPAFTMAELRRLCKVVSKGL